MRPSWRKPVGVLGLLAGLIVYALLVSRLLAPISEWPTLVQAVIYFVLGTAWLLPLRPLLIWMESGNRD
jgi:hypothetical protein